MPTDAKAGCLYPNNARASNRARGRGFDNCVVCDMLGNVAELATANIFMAKDGVVSTPIANGTFLAGITRRRVLLLLRAAGITVNETILRYEDFQTDDEIFSSGNFIKVTPITRIDGRSPQPGPIYREARARGAFKGCRRHRETTRSCTSRSEAEVRKRAALNAPRARA